MPHYPHSGHKMFAVGIYNREVRSLVKENRSHDFFFDDIFGRTFICTISRLETKARRVNLFTNGFRAKTVLL